MVQHGLAVRDHFLPARDVGALLECAVLRRARGEFREAHIGADTERRQVSEIRGDSIGWLTEPLFEAERRLLVTLETLRLAFNREALLGLFELELHYARYPVGAAYARHVDQPRGREQRRVSMILYLNEAWTGADGGELRVFDAEGAASDIEPLGGRLVVFLSREREHEVLATRRERSSLCGWFRCRS